MRGSKRDSHHHLLAAGCAVRRARAAGGCRERGVRTRSLVCRQAAHRSSQRCSESTGAHISERLKGDLQGVYGGKVSLCRSERITLCNGCVGSFSGLICHGAGHTGWSKSIQYDSVLFFFPHVRVMGCRSPWWGRSRSTSRPHVSQAAPCAAAPVIQSAPQQALQPSFTPRRSGERRLRRDCVPHVCGAVCMCACHGTQQGDLTERRYCKPRSKRCRSMFRLAPSRCAVNTPVWKQRG
jgi:hypothetical protein